jgi:hypothetical protein
MAALVCTGAMIAIGWRTDEDPAHQTSRVGQLTRPIELRADSAGRKVGHLGV